MIRAHVPAHHAFAVGRQPQSHFPAHGSTLFLDLDGVMADFDGHFPELFGKDHRAMPDAEMWGAIHDYGTFFRDLPPCDGALKFFRDIEHLSPVILTACPAGESLPRFEDVAGQKRDWVNCYLGLDVPVIFAPGGKTKALYMRRAGDVLVDDFPRNIQRWNDAGGFGLHHRGDFGTTKERLSAHFNL